MTSVASVRIFVDDLPVAAAFYRDVIALREVWAGNEAIVFGDDPMVVVERADDEARDHGYVGRFTGIAFWTDDATAKHRDLVARGVTVHGPPKTEPWGGTLLHADDPSGNTITFLEADRARQTTT